MNLIINEVGRRNVFEVCKQYFVLSYLRFVPIKSRVVAAPPPSIHNLHQSKCDPYITKYRVIYVK